jgi:hypothetical protein
MPIAPMMHMPTLFCSRRVAARLVAAAAMAVVSGCSTDQLLTVDDIDTATPISVQTKAALPVLLAGAIGDVQGAYSGFGTDAQITQSAEFTDEFEFVETFPSRQEFDQRSIQLQNGTNTTIFRNLMRGYASAVRTQEAYARLDPLVPGHAQAYNLVAFSILLAGENYCSGVPFSKLTETGAAVYGEPMTRDAMFAYALAVADSSIAVLDAMPVTAAATVQRNFALVLKGRALANLKRFAEAATAVAVVPTTFVVQFQHSDNTARENNGIFGLTFLDPRMSVANLEGGNGLPYRADADPRVPQRRGTGVGGEPSFGFDGSPMYLQLKYASRSANATVVSGVEARLIEAEAKLDASDAPGALAILNALRAPTGAGSGGVAGLAPLVDAGTATARVDQLFKERAYWLWLTSHRLGDLRRLVRQYGRGAETVFPTGAYLKGGLFGTDVNFPVPNDELNNPKFKQCIDRGA